MRVRHQLVCIALVLASAAAVAAPTTDYQLTVGSTDQSFAMNAGESQSAVVPPGKKSQCPAGRIIVTNDSVRPGSFSHGVAVDTVGVAQWRDLNAAHEGQSTFLAAPNATDYSYVSNDHNIVALPDGSVVYQIAAATKRPLTDENGKQPSWLPFTFRGEFGPGTRSAQLTWRSSDCGETFSFVSQVDSAAAGHAYCGLPQAKSDDDAKGLFDMGGSDGPWLGVDPKSGVLTMTASCVGNEVIAPSAKQLLPVLGAPVSKTLVMTSANRGNTWTLRGVIPNNVWRATAVTGASGITIGVSNGVYAAAPTTGEYDFSVGYRAADGSPAGWPLFEKNANWGAPNADKKWTAKNVKANLYASTILSRVPGAGLVLLAYPLTDTSQTKAPAQTHGYRLVLYNPADDTMSYTLGPVQSLRGTGNGAIMHLTVVDPGDGPVLLYWYDLDAIAQHATVRGRFLFAADDVSEDFDISPGGGFGTVPGPTFETPYWYGDYKTAGAFSHVVMLHGPGPGGGADIPQSVVHEYYPIWVQPNQTIHYTRVSLRRAVELAKPLKPLKHVRTPQSWRKARIQDIATISEDQRERMEENEHMSRVPAHR